jgi:hypothetical protein
MIMGATAAQIAQLRRMASETTTTTYSDAALTGYIERYPLLDERGQQPHSWVLANPPTLLANPLWIATYDLHAAAADIWTEKGAALAGGYDFSADGGDFKRSQAYTQALQQARYYAARRRPRPLWAHVWPTQSNTEPQPGNAPEAAD